MGKFLVKRVLYIIPTFLILTLIVFIVLSLAPGYPVAVLVGDTATEEQYMMKEAELGLDKPLLIQYVKYMANMARGEYGVSWMTGQPIANEFMSRLPNTLLLLLYSLSLTIVIGIPLGVISAVKQYSFVDKATMITAMLLVSVPAFFLGLIAQIIFCLNLHWLPVTGADSF